MTTATVTTGFRKVDNLTYCIDFTGDSLRHSAVWAYLDCIMAIAQNHAFSVALAVSDTGGMHTTRIGPFLIGQGGVAGWPGLYERRSGYTESTLRTPDYAEDENGHAERGLMVEILNRTVEAETKTGVFFTLRASNGMTGIEVKGLRDYVYDVDDQHHNTHVAARVRDVRKYTDTWTSDSLDEFQFTLEFHNLDHVEFATGERLEQLSYLDPGLYRLQYGVLKTVVPARKVAQNPCVVCGVRITDTDTVLAAVHGGFVHIGHYLCFVQHLTTMRRCWCREDMEYHMESLILNPIPECRIL